MKKIIPFFSFFVMLMITSFGGNLVFAQECDAYFPMTQGVEFVHTHYDAKGKSESSTKHKVKSLTVEGGNINAVVEMQNLDSKGNKTMEMEYGVGCENGTLKIDMRSMMGPDMMGGMSNMEISIDADNLEYPGNPAVGQSLPDAMLKVSISTSGFSIGGIEIQVTDRKVAAMEKRTTPAGTFDCVVISQKEEAKVMGIKTSTSSKAWFAKNVGEVRTESYNNSGKLMGYDELTSLKR